MEAAGGGLIASAVSLLRRLPLELSLVRSSAAVLAGNAAARLLGFVFYVAAARLLEPGDYGTLAYALAIIVAASVVLTNSPGGLARFLARNPDSRPRQDRYYSNWVAVIALSVVASVALFIPLVPLTGLTGWLALGVVVNLANMAVFETYVAAQRGLGRFGAMGVYYTLANLLQLVAILVLGALGWRSAALFLVVYGLSAIAAAALMRVAHPTPLTFRLELLSRRQMARITRYTAPIIAQGVFWAFWWGSDIILIQHLLTPTATGNYAAAKTLTQILLLPPTALCMAAGPRMSRLAEPALRRELLVMLALAAVAILPAAALLALLQRPIAELFYGTKYPHLVDALTALDVGAALYGLYLVPASVWGALGRPVVGAVATACGTVATVAAGLLLIPGLHLLGGGIAFAAGAAAQLLFVSGFTLWGLYAGGHARMGHLPDEAMG